MCTTITAFGKVVSNIANCLRVLNVSPYIQIKCSLKDHLRMLMSKIRQNYDCLRVSEVVSSDIDTLPISYHCLESWGWEA